MSSELIPRCFSSRASASERTGEQRKAITVVTKGELDGELRTTLWEMLH